MLRAAAFIPFHRLIDKIWTWQALCLCLRSVTEAGNFQKSRPERSARSESREAALAELKKEDREGERERRRETMPVDCWAEAERREAKVTVYNWLKARRSKHGNTRICKARPIETIICVLKGRMKQIAPKDQGQCCWRKERKEREEGRERSRVLAGDKFLLLFVHSLSYTLLLSLRMASEQQL